MVELPGGAQAALDELLGSGFALLSLADAEGSSVAAALAALAAAGLDCRHIPVVAQSDDFLTHAGPEAMLRDCGGTLEAIIPSAGAQAVLLRPDRYVLAYLRRGDAQSIGAATAVAAAAIRLPSPKRRRPRLLSTLETKP